MESTGVAYRHRMQNIEWAPPDGLHRVERTLVRRSTMDSTVVRNAAIGEWSGARDNAGEQRTVLYVGTIDWRFDMDLVDRAA